MTIDQGGSDTTGGNGSGKRDKRPELKGADLIKAAALIVLMLTIEEMISNGKIIYILIGK